MPQTQDQGPRALARACAQSPSGLRLPQALWAEAKGFADRQHSHLLARWHRAGRGDSPAPVGFHPLPAERSLARTRPQAPSSARGPSWPPGAGNREESSPAPPTSRHRRAEGRPAPHRGEGASATQAPGVGSSTGGRGGGSGWPGPGDRDSRHLKGSTQGHTVGKEVLVGAPELWPRPPGTSEEMGRPAGTSVGSGHRVVQRRGSGAWAAGRSTPYSSGGGDGAAGERAPRPCPSTASDRRTPCSSGASLRGQMEGAGLLPRTTDEPGPGTQNPGSRVQSLPAARGRGAQACWVRQSKDWQPWAPASGLLQPTQRPPEEQNPAKQE